MNQPISPSQGGFEEIEPTALFCPKCQCPVSVRKRLLLVLPDGELYEYLCEFCGSSLGIKNDKTIPHIINNPDI
ncbi:MAG: hypothetical protein QMD71_04655 [bacterium]|nr:hypothetical protein [bacterium]